MYVNTDGFPSLETTDNAREQKGQTWFARRPAQFWNKFFLTNEPRFLIYKNKEKSMAKGKEELTI